tara:strand:+ start:384 stop:743 length:360 start_codon:yes stop_codon:yes gene_type:complete
MSIMSFINKLLPKKIVETNLKRLSRFLDLTQDPFTPEEKKEPVPHDDWFADNPPTYQSRHQYTPDYEKGAEEVVTMHEKMYRIATDRYNPFSIGGSENCHSDIDCPMGGSEEWHDSKPG